MKKYFLILLMVTCSLKAQQGPTVNCNNCEGALNRPYPVSGNWYNPDQSGSGFIIEIQKGFVSGFYFGYDEDGDDTWLIFNGPLTNPEDDSDVLWRLNSSFSKASNGNAINKPYQEPQVNNTGDTLVIDFISKHNARITINDGEIQNLTPLVYAVGASPEFAETDKAFPDLGGLWSFVYKRYSPETITQESLYFTDIYSIGELSSYTENGTKFIEYYIYKFYPFPPFEILGLGTLSCSNPFDLESEQREVKCELNGFAAQTLGVEYDGVSMVVPLGDLGAFNFTAELIKLDDENNGFTIEATRVNYVKSYEGE